MMGIINEDNSKKDLSPMIRESLNSFIERNKHIVCDIEVTAPWNRETIEPDKSFKHYKVLVTFIVVNVVSVISCGSIVTGALARFKVGN